MLRRKLTAFLLLALPLAVPGAARAASLTLAYEVDEGMMIEACGGFAFGCWEYSLEGSLELRIDTDSGTATIPAADLRLIGSDQGPFPPGSSAISPPLDGLVGTLDGRTLRFETPPDASRSVAWTLLLTEAGMVLRGTYDQGCCDLFVFTFNNISLREVRRDEPATVLLLGGGRFAVEARWRDFAGNEGQGRAVALSADSGTFWFFDADNTELVVKLLDGCASFGRFWFFAAGLTNVAVDLVVTDLASGLERVYTNPIGQAFQPILDTDAFATCGADGEP